MKSDSYAKRLWRLLTPFAVYFLVTMVVTFVFMYICISDSAGRFNIYSESGMKEFEKYVYDIVARHGLSITGIVSVCTIPFFIRMFRRDSLGIKKSESEGSPVNYIILAILGISASLALNALLSVTKISEIYGSEYSEVAATIYTAPMWEQILVSACIAPVLEELMFRGLIFRRMRTYAIFPLAMLVSAALFGIFHGNLLQFLYATALGFISAYIYEKYNTILAPIIIHMCANAFSVILSQTENGIAVMMSGTDTRLVVTTVIASIIAIVCLVLVSRIKSNRSLTPDGLYEEATS